MIIQRRLHFIDNNKRVAPVPPGGVPLVQLYVPRTYTVDKKGYKPSYTLFIIYIWKFGREHARYRYGKGTAVGTCTVLVRVRV